MDVYRKQIQAFRRKFGREMRADDPFFFDPNQPSPEFRNPEDAQFAVDLLAELMGDAGIDPETIYAFKSTGGLFPSQDYGLCPSQQLEWDDAVREYQEKLRNSSVH
jgi:hypothetical protein